MKSSVNASRSPFAVDHDEWISYSHWGCDENLRTRARGHELRLFPAEKRTEFCGQALSSGIRGQLR
ncbi:hypothetical protein ACVWWO_000445 [Bradyrhizobium sp. F1.13.1]